MTGIAADHLNQVVLDKGELEWEGKSGLSAPIFFDGGGDMLEVNGLCLFDLGNINQLFMLPEGQGLNANFYKINEILFHIESFANAKQNQVNLPDSVKFAKNIIMTINLHRKEKVITTARVKEHFDYLLHNFRTVLSSELGKVTTILLEEIGGHSVQTLWKHQLVLLEGVGSNLSAFVKSNFSEAAKCLVLNCHTAVGFHCVRSIEHVARKYYELVIGKKPLGQYNKFLPLGSIAQELLDRNDKLDKGDKSNNLVIIASLMKAINKENRDPLAHPQITKLNKAEAIEIFYDARQVIIKVIGDAKTGGAHFSTPWKRGFLF